MHYPEKHTNKRIWSKKDRPKMLQVNQKDWFIKAGEKNILSGNKFVKQILFCKSFDPKNVCDFEMGFWNPLYEGQGQESYWVKDGWGVKSTILGPLKSVCSWYFDCFVLPRLLHCCCCCCQNATTTNKRVHTYLLTLRFIYIDCTFKVNLSNFFLTFLLGIFN